MRDNQAEIAKLEAILKAIARAPDGMTARKAAVEAKLAELRRG
jgi:hypothetical protein